MPKLPRSFGLSLAVVHHALRFIPARCLHVAMLIVCCMAWAGPGAESASQYIQTQESVEFPALGRGVQQAEIALTVLCLVFDPAISIIFYRWTSKMILNDVQKTRPKNLKFLILFVQGPWYLASLAGWIVCIVFQASYVPILGGKKLELCNISNPAQCKLVTASWILSIFFCVDHFILILLCVLSLLYLPAY
ncbi:hypothetical protein BKA56DRAFT_580780 [Ilyonectria sp. MPI-CAGE-AT-0026]|nr:hypothetical protein BKA56DRAFT_580780 [Ilyonectria sp. MPI-CAGE-AT-0026]